MFADIIEDQLNLNQSLEMKSVSEQQEKRDGKDLVKKIKSKNLPWSK